MSDDKAMESRLRRTAKRLGWRIEKSRARNLHINNKGQYQLINDSNTVIVGVDYDASLEDVEFWIAKEKADLAA